MPLTFEPGCQAAIDLAKRALADGATLDAGTLLAALYRDVEVQNAHPGLDAYLPRLEARRPQTPERVGIAEDIQPVFQRFAGASQPITASELFAALAASDSGQKALRESGAPAEILEELAEPPDHDPLPPTPPPGQPGWRASDARRRARESLDAFGRLLTACDLPQAPVVEREDSMRALIRTLSKMRRRNAIVIGPAGSGKSALVYELARRMARGDSSLPPRLRDMDIFELSPTFLRSGASVVGQYEERMKMLLGVLQANPRIILFVDEIHALLQSGVHDRGPFTDANESFKAALGRGEITCLGCTTPGEYRRYIEPDAALARRFGIIRLEPPSAAATLGILAARRAAMEAYYAPLRIPEKVLARAVTLTDEYLVARNQPDKSIQLLDEACAHCVTADPPLPEVTEETLIRALEDMVGHGIAHRGQLTEASVLGALRARIVGQEPALGEIAHAFVAGFGDWSRRAGPRGVLLFGGPTGTGKTETALVLAGLLGVGERNLIRVDCNTLQGSALDAGPAIARLLGVPPGYVGYARGQGGILSRIRDVPECVVLFDEFEKAAPGVGRLLLQIIDDGRVEDTDGNVLDFRRAFIIFTTNAGCRYDARPLGFSEAGFPEKPAVDLDSIRNDLRAIGLGEEFIGRLSRTVLFQGLDRAAVKVVLERQLERLRRRSELRGLELGWSPEFVPHLVRIWQPRFGVRFATAILRNRIGEQLDLADAQGELMGATTIRLEVCTAAGGGPAAPAGLASRERMGDTLIIRVA